MLLFFPYCKTTDSVDKAKSDFYQNPLVISPETGKSLTIDKFHSGCSEVPFYWKIDNKPHVTILKMALGSGFLNITQDPETLSLKPEIGWAILDKSRSYDIKAEKDRELEKIFGKQQ